MGLNGILGRIVSERRIYVATGDQTAHARLTPTRQIGLGLLCTALVGWTAFATILIATDAMAPRTADSAILVQGVQQNRIDNLLEERANYAAQAEAARVRYERAAQIMSAQQAQIVGLQTDIAEATRITMEQRDTLDRRQMALVAREDALKVALDQVETLAEDLTLRSDQAEDLGRTVNVLLDGLSRTAQDRNGMAAELAGFASERAALEARATLAEQRQERVVDRLERAVEGSIAELELVFTAAGANIQSMFPTGAGYTGQGGPDVLIHDHDAHGDPSLDRVGLLLNRISDLDARRNALEQMPFAGPVHAAYRQTSSFGTRRDPINGRTRNHNGLDFAAPVGTPLYATGAGEVVTAGRSGAFGNLVRIRHAFGYETLYAHMSRIRVAVGDRVEAGDRIGDMGSTGRSTGSHLHYEVHRDGRPVDPMTYLKAAEDVL
jgi:murein DD-endopeptidase MepM/ murein hydrolase activator NlpD